jgi:flagellar basal body-associated protein FliL
MNVVLWVVGIAASAGAIYFFDHYAKQPSENTGFSNMIYAIICVAVACVCAFIWFYKKTKEQADQDISITKF